MIVTNLACDKACGYTSSWRKNMVGYYYARGHKVPISVDRTRVAVNPARAAEIGVGSFSGAGNQVKLPGGMLVLARADIPKDIIERLTRVGALQSVYKQGPNTIVPAAEIRIEVDNPAQRARVRRALSSTTIRADIVDETEDRFVVRPRSGRGDDAIELANEVAEKARPGMSSARMLQVVERPDVHRE